MNSFEDVCLNLETNAILDIYGSMLSGGQKKKLKLVHLLLSKCKNKFIILDEVEAGLDKSSLEIYHKIVNEIIDRKSNIVLIVQHSDSSKIKYNKELIFD